MKKTNYFGCYLYLTVSCVKNNEIDIRKAIIERAINTFNNDSNGVAK